MVLTGEKFLAAAGHILLPFYHYVRTSDIPTRRRNWMLVLPQKQLTPAQRTSLTIFDYLDRTVDGISHTNAGSGLSAMRG